MQAAEFLLGTVSDVSGDGVKILFDGQTEATEKRYKQINTGVQLAEDDRIVVMKISGSYVVLGRIAYNQSGGGGSVTVDDELSTTSENPVQNKVITNALSDKADASDLSGKVAKAGDTMTGDLGFEGSEARAINFKNTSITKGTIPTGATTVGTVVYRDSNNASLGQVYNIFNANARSSMVIRATNGSPSTNNDLIIGVNSDGSKVVSVTDSALWRSALGIDLLTPSAAFAIPASGSSVSKDMAGLTANHVLIAWNFSASPENMPPVDLTWTTYNGYFTVANNGGTTSETIKPVFALATAIEISNH